MDRSALRNVRVVEFAELVAGPYGAKLLADLGAEVIKIEPPEGDEARRRGPFPGDVPHGEKSGLFLYNNANKLGVTLNLRTVAGRHLFRQLVAEADVLIEDKPPGAMQEFGLGAAELHSVNPQLIVTSVTPFGQTGPHRGLKAYHLNVFHGGGEGYLVPGGLSWDQFPERQPLQAGGFVADYDAGLGAATATLVALHSRFLDEQGQHVDVSKQEVQIGLNRGCVTTFTSAGLLETRSTRAYSAGGMFRCKDGYVFIHGSEAHQWRRLVEFMGCPEWTKDPRIATSNGRRQHWDEFKHYVCEWALTLSQEELYEGCRARDIPVGVYASAEEVVCSPQMGARVFFVQLEHPEAGALPYASAGYRFSQTPWRGRRPAPLLGQHNEEVFCGRLGLGREDLVRLRQGGII